MPPHEVNYLRLDITKAINNSKCRNSLDFKQTYQLTKDWYRKYLIKGDIEKISNDQIECYFEML